MKMTDITSIGRPIDLHYPTNRAIAAVTLVVTIGGLLWQRLTGAPWSASALWGAHAGLAVFLAWALCRELDPDRPMAAFPAAGIALLALLLWRPPRLAPIFWLLILLRVVNRTAGTPAGLLDALGLVALAGWLSLRGNWGYGVITTLALCLDAILPNPVRRQLAFALLAALVTAAAAALGAPPPWEAPSLASGLIALGLSLLLLPVIISSRSVESVGDQTGDRLEPVRVQTAQILALLIGVETAFLGGPSALAALSPLWAAALGASLVWLYRTLTPSNSPL